MTTTTFVYDPPKLRRLSRRRTWRCRVDCRSAEERFRHAAAVRVAAQAVAVQHFGIPLRRLDFDPRRRYATLDAEWQSLRFGVRVTSLAARTALEFDCIAVLAGIVARAFALGWQHTTYGWHDQELVADLLERLEYDDPLRTSWYGYQLERARIFVSEPAIWTQIEILAARLRHEPVMDGPRVADLLAEARREPLIVPAQIAWKSPASSAPSNVTLVWQKPGLTEIVARATAHLRADDGDDQ